MTPGFFASHLAHGVMGALGSAPCLARYHSNFTSIERRMNFQTQHLATLAKYAGISFIAGAVNHGMFSEQRSLLTAAIGVVFYLIGAAMELKASNDGSKSWADLLGFGIVASIGLGFFTGGLQHFPDSPQRSLWVVPLGFFLSLLALYFVRPEQFISP